MNSETTVLEVHDIRSYICAVLEPAFLAGSAGNVRRWLKFYFNCCTVGTFLISRPTLRLLNCSSACFNPIYLPVFFAILVFRALDLYTVRCFWIMFPATYQYIKNIFRALLQSRFPLYCKFKRKVLNTSSSSLLVSLAQTSLGQCFCL